MVKGLFAAALFCAATAGAAAVERSVLPISPATCSCKGKGDCTCAKGQCRCKNCGNAAHRQMMVPLQGQTENTRLPTTARGEARGGTAI